jgi:hypothetical protein
VKEKLLHGRLDQGGRTPEAPGATSVRNGIGPDGAALRQGGENARFKFAFARSQLARPRAVPAGAGVHRVEQVRPGVGREDDENAGGWQVVFKGETLRGGQRGVGPVHVPHQVAHAVTGDAVAQDEVVHAPADIDRIDLHVPVVAERRVDPGRGRIKQQRPAHEAPRRGRGDFERSRQRPPIERSCRQKTRPRTTITHVTYYVTCGMGRSRFGSGPFVT